MLSLACYFDDSGDEQIHVVGGYLANLEVWDDLLAPAWNDALRTGPRPISEFKASDCRNGVGEFGPPWTREDRQKLMVDLVSILTEMPLLAGVSSAFFWPGVVDPGQRNISRARHRVAKSSYGMNVGMCLAAAFDLCQALPGVSVIQPVFDRGKFFERVIKNFDTVRKHLNREWAAKLASPVEEIYSLPALQAADLLAHETYKEIVSRCDGRAPSRALERLFIESKTPYLARILAMPPLAEYDAARKRGERPRPTPHLLFGRGRDLRAPGNWGCS